MSPNKEKAQKRVEGWKRIFSKRLKKMKWVLCDAPHSNAVENARDRYRDLRVKSSLPPDNHL